jgi:hypothetical protein
VDRPLPGDQDEAGVRPGSRLAMGLLQSYGRHRFCALLGPTDFENLLWTSRTSLGL